MPKSRCRTQHASGREGKVVVGGRLGRSLPAGPVPNGPTRTPRRRGAGTQSIGPHSLPKVDSEVIEGGSGALRVVHIAARRPAGRPLRETDRYTKADAIPRGARALAQGQNTLAGVPAKGVHRRQRRSCSYLSL